MVTRIRQLLEYKQLTPTQFADLIGVGRPVMSHILSERNKPSLEVVKQMSSAFPDISLAWLMFGTGEMLAAAIEPAPLAPVTVTPATPAPDVALEISEASLSAVLEAPVPTPEVALPAPVALPRRAGLPSPALAATVAAPAPVHIEPATFPQPVSSPVVAPAAAPTPLPVLPKPFRALRFVPSAPQASVPAPEVVAPLATPIADPVAPIAPALSPPAAPPVSTAPEAAMLPFLTESGKAIRRIVIFYRDGSFTDYQPE